MSLVGIHLSNIAQIEKNKLFKNIKLFQFFVSPMIDYEKDKYIKLIEYAKNKKITFVVHASYSINMARRWNTSDWWIQQLINEIKAASSLGAIVIVVHTGKSLELSISEAINNMYSSFLFVCEQTKHSNVKILIETPSGQGTETLTKIDDLCNFMNKFYKHPDISIANRFGLCVDTCHVFAAGYNLSAKKQMDYFFSTIDKMIGLDKIKLVHVNDSKGDLKSHIDRHENIGMEKLEKMACLELSNLLKNSKYH